MRKQVEDMVAVAGDERIKVWLLVRLAGERSAMVGRRFGYRDGAGVAYVLRRVEAEASKNAVLAEKLQQAKQAIYSLQSDPITRRPARPRPPHNLGQPAG